MIIIKKTTKTGRYFTNYKANKIVFKSAINSHKSFLQKQRHCPPLPPACFEKHKDQPVRKLISLPILINIAFR